MLRKIEEVELDFVVTLFRIWMGVYQRIECLYVAKEPENCGRASSRQRTRPHKSCALQKTDRKQILQHSMYTNVFRVVFGLPDSSCALLN